MNIDPVNGKAVFYDVTAAREGMSRMAARQTLTVLQHNSVCAALGQTMDVLSYFGGKDAPSRTAASAIHFDSDGNPYSDQDDSPLLYVVTYHGPQDNYDGREIPAMGWMGPPDQAQYKEWWLATKELLRRIADGSSLAAATSSGANAPNQQDPNRSERARLVMLYAEAAEAAFALDMIEPGQIVREPTRDGTAQNVQNFYQGASLLALNGTLAVDAPPANATAEQTASFNATVDGLARASSLAEKLSAEERAEEKSANRRVTIGLLVALAVSLGIGSMD